MSEIEPLLRRSSSPACAGEADRLWAEESQRRLDQHHAGQAKTVSVDAVHAKVNKLLR